MTATLIFVNKITCLTVNSEYSYGKYMSPFCETCNRRSLVLIKPPPKFKVINRARTTSCCGKWIFSLTLYMCWEQFT